MIDKALTFIANIPEKWINAVGAFFASLTFFDYIDFAWRIVTGLITVVMFVFAWKRHRIGMEVKRLEKEKLEQEIGDLIQANKKKYG